MSPPEGQATVGASPVLGLAIGVLCLVPQWAWVAWLATSALPWRRDVESGRARGVAWAFGMASIALSLLGLDRLHRALGESGLEAYFPAVSEAWLAHQAVVAVAVIWVARRRGAANAAPPAAARRGPPPRTIGIVLLAWVALSGVVVALRMGPLGGRPGAEHASGFLVLAVAVIATLVVLLLRAIRETRRTG